MRKIVWRLLVAATLAGVAILAKTTADIHRFGHRDTAQRADVIVVLGAAEYRGRPSPVLRARLDHGLALYRRGLAPRILTTGGAGGDPVFTEGEVGRDYLIRHGVPPEAIIVEPQGSSTAESAAATTEIMRRMDLKSCIVVTDPYHLYRATRMLASRGLDVYGSPRPTRPAADLRYWWLCTRQAFGYLLWSAGVAI